jgi:hypothetical protein
MDRQPPTTSSGKVWTDEEDKRLYLALLDLVAQFEGRSMSAILSRIALLSAGWWKNVGTR